MASSTDEEHHPVYAEHLGVLAPLFSLVEETSGTVQSYFQPTPSVSPGGAVMIRLCG